MGVRLGSKSRIEKTANSGRRNLAYHSHIKSKFRKAAYVKRAGGPLRFSAFFARGRPHMSCTPGGWRRFLPDKSHCRDGRLSPRRPLCRPHPQGRQSGRPADRTFSRLIPHQSQDSEDARHCLAADPVGACRRGDRGGSLIVPSGSIAWVQAAHTRERKATAKLGHPAGPLHGLVMFQFVLGFTESRAKP